ncbi:MAG TPA: NAD(P)/FAD-dependent oxidoreductase [Burkholderiales bacterium]|nr:NAD(P)/FAD-dependent oxidoreductase [Burkholderiales bacterium]
MSAPTVVIGAGTNELVAAHYLALAGNRIVVLGERGADPDSAAGWIPPRVVRDLRLAHHGLRIERPDPWAVAPLPEGGRLELWHDMARSVESIRRLSARDADKWPEFCARMARLGRLLETLYAAPPPDPLASELRDLAQLAAIGLRTRRLGRQGMTDLLRLLPMSVADFLDDWFESDALKGVLGAAGVMHLQQGPRSGGTAFALLHQHVGSPVGVFRAARVNVERTLAGLPGVEIRRGLAVERIRVRDGRATGVVLGGGREIAAALVVSGADPRRTLLELVEPGWLDAETVRAVRSIRSRGVVAQVTLTLDRAAAFPMLVVAPSLDYLERAYDDAKYRRVPQRPYLEARAHGQRVNVHVQYAPYAPADGAWDDARRAALGARVEEMLSPHLGAAVIERIVQSPRDLEEAYGWPEGQAHQAELALDQLLWMRPTPALARYRTPIVGLYLCGPAMHPGAGIAGAAGAHAARVMLRDSRRGTTGR